MPNNDDATYREDSDFEAAQPRDCRIQWIFTKYPPLGGIRFGLEAELGQGGDTFLLGKYSSIPRGGDTFELEAGLGGGG